MPSISFPEDGKLQLELGQVLGTPIEKEKRHRFTRQAEGLQPQVASERLSVALGFGGAQEGTEPEKGD